MGRVDIDERAMRHSVVPASARRSPWPAAVWTGLGSAVVCATTAIIVVAVCWLPASSGGHTSSAIRAGLLTFLASLHGGITVDGVATGWLPLGMLLVVGTTAWRAGAGLADAADEMDERDPARLTLAMLVQALTFTAGCLIAVPFATLGTSRAPLFGVGVAAFVVFLLFGATSFIRSSALRATLAEHVPTWTGQLLRAGAAVVTVYLAAGALLAAGSLVLHHAQAEAISSQVGGGIGGIPIALLGVLAAPNAAIAGAGYLAGPGFAIGAGTGVNLFSSAHGVLPAFPILAAVPTGPGTSPVAWGLAALTPLVAAIALTRLSLRVSGWPARFAAAAGSALVAGGFMFLLAWQGGGAVGDGRLSTVGVSPWQLGGAVAATMLVGTAVLLGLGASWQWVRAEHDDIDGEDDEPFLPVRRTPRMVVVPAPEADTDADADINDEDDVEDEGEGGSDNTLAG